MHAKLRAFKIRVLHAVQCTRCICYKFPYCSRFQIAHKTTTKLQNCVMLSKAGPLQEFLLRLNRIYNV